MDKDYRLARHTQLWEVQNRRVSRLVLAGLAFAALLLFNVLQPYTLSLEEEIEIRGQIEGLRQEQQEIDASLKRLDEFETTLVNLNDTVARQPWMQRKERLIRRYRDMRDRGEGSPSEWQAEADLAVADIAAEVREVVEPLERYLNEEPEAAELMPGFYDLLRELPSVIEEWVDTNTGQLWYRTLDEKEATVEDLTRSLGGHLEQISAAVQAEQPNLVTRRNALEAEINGFEESTREQTELLEELDEVMQSILPEWVRGLISIEQMVQIYPLVVLGMALYLVGIALSLTTHFRTVAREKEWSSLERSDPIYSSIWTLTYRGRVGTGLTLGAYLAVLLVLWFFFESGAHSLDRWMAADNLGAISAEGTQIAYWLARLVLLTVIGTLAFQPYLDWPNPSSDVRSS